MAAFASSYAGVLNHLFAALECFIKAEIHLFEIRTTGSAGLVEDLMGSIQPFLDLHEDRRRILGLAVSETNALEAVIREVSPFTSPSISRELNLF